MTTTDAITWRDVESSNVARIGWPTHYSPAHERMFVQFKNGHVYAYFHVSRQRAVAATRAKSVGSYINQKIKPVFPSVQVG